MNIKFSKFAKLLLLALIINQADAKENLINISVPFQNLTLNPNGKIQANFAFGPHQIIFCFPNSISSVVGITWPFKGRQLSAQTPIALKTNGNIDGQFSDPSGVLTIQNTPDHGAAQMSCVFAF